MRQRSSFQPNWRSTVPASQMPSLAIDRVSHASEMRNGKASCAFKIHCDRGSSIVEFTKAEQLKWKFVRGPVSRAIRYRVKGEPMRAYACHCTFCQRHTGGAML